MEFSFESVVYFLYKFFCFYEVARLRPFKDQSDNDRIQWTTSADAAFYFIDNSLFL